MATQDERSTAESMNNPADPPRYLTIRDRLFELLSNEYNMILVTVVPVLLLFFFISVLPALWAIWASFHEIPIYSTNWEWIGFDNYVSMLLSTGFWDSLLRSLIFAGGSVAIQVTAGTMLALLVNQSFKGVRFIRAIVLLPYLIPTIIMGYAGLWMMNSQFGIVNLILVESGILIEPIPWFGSVDLAMPSLIIINSWKFSIFVTIFVLARLQSINDGFYEAAEVAGANTYQKFRDITLPNIKGVLLIVILLRGIFMMNKFDIIDALTGGGPGDATATAPIFAYERAFNVQSLGEASAVSVLLFLIIFIGALVYFVVFNPEEEVRVE